MSEPTPEQTAAAEAAGLPAELAHRLHGDDADALAADAQALAKAITPPAPVSDIGGGTIREVPKPRAEQIRDLARENPREFNRRVERGEIDLSSLR